MKPSISTIDEFLENVNNLQIDVPEEFQCPFCSKQISVNGGCCSEYTEALDNLLSSYNKSEKLYLGYDDALVSKSIQLECKDIIHTRADVLPLDIFKPKKGVWNLWEISGVLQDNILYFYVLLSDDTVYKCSIDCSQFAEERKNRVIKIYQLVWKTVALPTAKKGVIGNYRRETQKIVVDCLSHQDFLEKLKTHVKKVL